MSTSRHSRGHIEVGQEKHSFNGAVVVHSLRRNAAITMKSKMQSGQHGQGIFGRGLNLPENAVKTGSVVRQFNAPGHRFPH